MDQKEIWRQAVDREGNPISGYEVSNLGRVRSLTRYVEYSNRNPRITTGVVLKQKLSKAGYFQVHTSSHQKHIHYSVHILVALAFPETCGTYKKGLTVDHLSGNKQDNRAENLRFVTIKENIRNPNTLPACISRINRYRHLAYTPEIRRIVQLANQQKVVCPGLLSAEYLGVTPTAVSNCIKGKSKTVAGFEVFHL